MISTRFFAGVAMATAAVVLAGCGSATTSTPSLSASATASAGPIRHFKDTPIKTAAQIRALGLPADLTATYIALLKDHQDTDPTAALVVTRYDPRGFAEWGFLNTDDTGIYAHDGGTWVVVDFDPATEDCTGLLAHHVPADFMVETWCKVGGVRQLYTYPQVIPTDSAGVRSTTEPSGVIRYIDGVQIDKAADVAKLVSVPEDVRARVLEEFNASAPMGIEVRWYDPRGFLGYSGYEWSVVDAGVNGKWVEVDVSELGSFSCVKLRKYAVPAEDLGPNPTCSADPRHPTASIPYVH